MDLPQFASSTQSIAFVPPLSGQELDRLWNELCHSDPKTKKPTGYICKIVRRRSILKYKPRDMGTDEFFDTVLNETAIRFKRYNYSFQPPMERWLMMQAKSAAKDIQKKWTPAFRYKEEYQPKEWIPFERLEDAVNKQPPAAVHVSSDLDCTETETVLPTLPLPSPTSSHDSMALLFRFLIQGHAPRNLGVKYIDHVRKCNPCYVTIRRVQRRRTASLSLTN